MPPLLYALCSMPYALCPPAKQPMPSCEAAYALCPSRWEPWEPITRSRVWVLGIAYALCPMPSCEAAYALLRSSLCPMPFSLGTLGTHNPLAGVGIGYCLCPPAKQPMPSCEAAYAPSVVCSLSYVLYKINYLFRGLNQQLLFSRLERAVN